MTRIACQHCNEIIEVANMDFLDSGSTFRCGQVTDVLHAVALGVYLAESGKASLRVLQ